MDDADQIMTILTQRQARDLPVHGGRTLAYVYDSGLADVDDIARRAVAAYAGSNGLDPTAFPSLPAMENELVGFALDLVHGPDTAVGTVTSGGTESVLLAVQTARDAHPEIIRPRMILPTTAHAAFHKAAHYFGVEPVLIPVREDFRADPDAMASAVDDHTVLVVASAPSYAHGVVDPVTQIAAIAAAQGIRCHVDACIGGWILPFAADLGRMVPDWDFTVPGVTSISVDLHKYAYAPKGAALLLHRTPQLRRTQFFASADWPGYTMLNSTLQSTKSGGPLAGAWAVVQAIGRDGYRDLARQVLGAVDEVLAGLADIPQLSPVVTPDSTLLAVATDDSCDPFTISDELGGHGWYVQPQLSHGGQRPSIHLSLSAATAPAVGDFLDAVRTATAAATARGPAKPDPDIFATLSQLDPTQLDETTFQQLVLSSGLVTADRDGNLALPDRMAGVNALLDAAPAPVREALLIGFLDALSRPVRPGN